MKNSTGRIAAMTVAALISASGGLWAQEWDETEKQAGLEARGEVSVLSSYVWRGRVLNDENVVQPYLKVTKNGLGASVWGNFNLTDRITEKNEFSEMDVNLFYTIASDGAELTLGIGEYLYPNWTVEVPDEPVEGAAVEEPVTTHTENVRGTREVYAKYSLPNAFLAPALEVYYDIDEAEGFYVNAMVEHEISVVKGKFFLIPGAWFGWADSDFNTYYYGVDKSTWNDGNAYLNAA